MIADKGFEKTVYLLVHAVLSFEILVLNAADSCEIAS